MKVIQESTKYMRQEIAPCTEETELLRLKRTDL
jgi:hypothetical protein